MNTSARQKTPLEYMIELAKLIARWAQGALDGEQHGPRVIPTRLSSAMYVGNALSPSTGPDSEGKGFTPDQLFAAAAGFIPADALAAHELLAHYYNRLAAEFVAAKAKDPSVSLPRMAAFVLVNDFDLADGDGEVSLWCRFMQAAWPESAQTPGSPRWNAAGPNAKRDSQVNAFAPWLKTTGNW